jgi:integrase/recombinase XerD
MSDTRNLKKRGNIWWFVKQKNNQTIEQSLATADLGVAKARRDRIAQDLRENDGLKWGERRKRTFEAVAEWFSKKHFPVVRPTSARRYVTSLNQLVPHFGNMQIDEIRSAHLTAFQEKRLAAGVTNSSIRRDLACMSVLYSYAEAREWVTRNPVKPFLFEASRLGLKENDARERFLKRPEEDLILDHIAPKAGIAATFAIDTGLRKNEQFSLPWVDVDLRARELLVRKEWAKSKRDRTVPILDRTHRLLTQMWANRTSPYVFATAQGRRYSLGSPTMWEALQKAVFRINKASALAGHPRMQAVEWHDLRRTCGCRLLQDRGFTMEAVSKWLGHSSVKVTERHYAFLTKDELHKAVARSEAKIIPLGRAEAVAAAAS